MPRVTDVLTPAEARRHVAQTMLLDPAKLQQLLSIDVSKSGIDHSKHQLAVQSLVTLNERMEKVKQNAILAAQHQVPVLITGETGTGKDLLARIIHGVSPGEFVPMNCAGLTDELFMSELCGYVTGAFTGAVRDTPGAIRSAKNGTVFLDEVGELPLSQQSKLLLILQPNADRTYNVRPVGSPKSEPVRTRFVFATNRDIYAMVKAGTFRADLYARISTVKLHTVPLRDRPEDIPPIVRALCTKHGLPQPVDQEFPPCVYETFNVRGIENALVAANTLGYDSVQLFLEAEIDNYPEYATTSNQQQQ